MNCYCCDSKKLVYKADIDSYVCLNCGYVYPKQYFFVSHSHLDIEKVRIVRNTIEETFFYEPILFFLKCLSEEREINDLLRREIYERIWFIYCKSDNAARSKYVQQEVDYMNELRANGKKIHYVEIDLDKYALWDDRCANYIREQILPVIKRSKVFLSYSAYDTRTAEHIKTALSNNGLTVWETRDLIAGANWTLTVQDRIKEHSYKDGLILFIVSRHSANNHACAVELETARRNNVLILPAIIDDGICQEILLPDLSDLQPLRISPVPTQDELERLIQAIRTL